MSDQRPSRDPAVLDAIGQAERIGDRATANLLRREAKAADERQISVEVYGTANEAFVVTVEGTTSVLRPLTDEPEDDGAPCCRAQVTAGRDSGEHEPGCQSEAR